MLDYIAMQQIIKSHREMGYNCFAIESLPWQGVWFELKRVDSPFVVTFTINFYFTTDSWKLITKIPHKGK